MAKNTSDSSRRLKILAAVLCAIFIAAFGAYRYFKTDGGRVFLLDAGVESRFAQVQVAMEKRIVNTIKRFGVTGDRMSVASAEEPGSMHPVTILRVETPPDASLVQINVAISRAVGEIGGRVRSCREGKDGSIITMELGTRRLVTQRCIIRKGSEREHFARKDEHPTPVVAICVDDFGFFNNSLVREFLELDVPLTISVIPGLKYSEKVCREAAEAGKDILCHLPMEAEKEGWDAGDIPLIRVSMKPKEIERALTKALATTPGVVGINNHMGSRATADRKVMQTVLRICKTRGLFFFDSMTTPHSVVREVAKEVGATEAGNDLFLDRTEGESRENMRKLLSIASQRGAAIGILHVKSQSLEDLRWMIDEARKQGIDFLTISQMIARRNVALAEGGRF
ncbi:MAG TPA: divergent polysaccharide deacetylase family protein [Candidatus Bathyarchaeia archaeon]|nr:divergent polysaccharide deacetylase family protein [Candidatus Bathyarchaeia archaeon]